MRSRTSSPLSTLLFFVPLLGVPLMAIFGVPQFVPVIASSVSEETIPPLSNRRFTKVGESATTMPQIAERLSRHEELRDDEKLNDFFRLSERPRRERPVGRSSGNQFVETSLASDTWPAPTPARTKAVDNNASLEDLFGSGVSSRKSTSRDNSPQQKANVEVAHLESSAAATPAGIESRSSDEGLSWRQAVRRLNELGIEEFRLEPGSKVGEFYFACEFAPDRDARIMRRFEAEASEPLLAVEAVLRQIEEWLPRR